MGGKRGRTSRREDAMGSSHSEATGCSKDTCLMRQRSAGAAEERAGFQDIVGGPGIGAANAGVGGTHEKPRICRLLPCFGRCEMKKTSTKASRRQKTAAVGEVAVAAATVVLSNGDDSSGIG